ncbi:ABC transporter permease [Variovorax ginsengisoli]|uniref:ABC transporter permease n=1 Tax=Variovorax ginsengisoli TaxID=363844 RepID=A0ABT8SDX9_9BURK|nr:ABC transporter permease [Variovorax ginsengisoli]MDN8617948.1 ABC transporter permease [Variovorax ginsengisoli]MDO1537118.1 ABC transporter permease [Variovorax ginsengisoli]
MAASNGLAGNDAVPRMTPAARNRAFDTAASKRWLGSMTGILLLASLWEIAPRAGWLSRDFFPPLSVVLGRLSVLVTTEEFWGFVASTIRTCVLGLAIAAIAGVLIGLAIGLTPGARKYTHSTIEFLRPIPSVALIPGVILLFGARYQSGVVLITYAAFWQVLLQMLYGLNDIDSVARDTARTFRFSRFGYVRHVAWPTLLPYLFTGLRLAAAMALVLAVTAEMVIGSQGVGRGIVVAQASNATAEAYAYVLVAGLMGVAINLAARLLERRLLQWHPSVRNTGGAR